ncbi:MAG: dethiobiotin synthase [Verrucomicrobiota bacterium]|nr:dethiobiotin synthase [Verrucomicrobiota bacterium]
MTRVVFFVTGTDTGVGKTVLGALLARSLGDRGVLSAALKPVCSGGRADARALQVASNGALTLDEINPWRFRAPVAPSLAACQDNRKVRLSEVLAHLRAMRKRFDVLVVEGAGGLLSPLGDQFDSRNLITALGAVPIVVCPNRLGAINQVRLTLEALSRRAKAKARIVLMSPERPDSATGTNGDLLAGFFDARRLFTLPWLGRRFDIHTVLKQPSLRRTLRELTWV